jgi:hypothetical protein
MGIITNQLREKASELGFSFQRGIRKGAGYVLVNDANGDKPLGNTYTASLVDIDRYLDSFADDAGLDDVEIGSGEPSKPPPTKAEMVKSLQGNTKAGEIKKALNPPSSTQQEQHDRIALDRLMRVGMDARSAMAFDRLSADEKEKHFANLRAAMAKEEKAKAAQSPKPTLPLRDKGLNSDHPLAQEKARQGRVFHKAGQRWKTNIASLRDCDSDGYQNHAPHFDGEQSREEIDRAENMSGLPPDQENTDPTPKPTTSFTIAKQGRLSKADRLIRQRLFKARGGIREALARNDQPAAGAMLREVKGILDHGEFGDWVAREIGISIRTAERCLEAAKSS